MTTSRSRPVTCSSIAISRALEWISLSTNARAKSNTTPSRSTSWSRRSGRSLASPRARRYVPRKSKWTRRVVGCRRRPTESDVEQAARRSSNIVIEAPQLKKEVSHDQRFRRRQHLEPGPEQSAPVLPRHSRPQADPRVRALRSIRRSQRAEFRAGLAQRGQREEQ